MLSRLHVRNLALVEDVAVEFHSGLNTITGETGAGKSILIGAISLLLGERADKTAIRAGEETALIEAVFHLTHADEINDLLNETGLSPCEDGQLILRRIIKSSGGGSATVNDSPVTLAFLKRLGVFLVDLHGPHDHQSLFSLSKQLEILDTYAKGHGQKAAYSKEWALYQALLEQQAELSESIPDMDAQIDLLQHRITEIETANPQPNEEDEVRTEQNTVGHAQRILELGQHITVSISEGDPSALDILSAARKAVDELARLYPVAVDWQTELHQQTDALAALAKDVEQSLSNLDVDPERLNWLDQRLATLERIKRKYGPSFEDIQNTLKQSKERLSHFLNREEQKAIIQKQISDCLTQLEQLASRLRDTRLKAAKHLEQLITHELQFLGFEYGRFEIAVEKSDFSANGMDRVEYHFAPNKGEPLQSLRAIASSGEISRVMLAIKVVLASADQIPLLVFDEIDANIGGETAHAVGKKLAEVAQTHQVLTITHLPIVAAFGAHQFAVQKAVGDDQRTRTGILPLDEKSRILELSRMLGGKESSSVVEQHARELLQAARDFCAALS